MQRYILQRYLQLFWPGKTIAEILLEEVPRYSAFYSYALQEHMAVNSLVIAAFIGTATGAYRRNCDKRTQVIVALLEYLSEKRLLIFYVTHKSKNGRTISIRLMYSPIYEKYLNGTEL